jgi:hypothetical protein
VVRFRDIASAGNVATAQVAYEAHRRAAANRGEVGLLVERRVVVPFSPKGRGVVLKVSFRRPFIAIEECSA